MQRERVRSVETLVLFFAVCGPKFTRLSACGCTGGEIAVCNAVCRLTISCFVPEIGLFAIMLQSCLKSEHNFDVLGRHFGGRPNILT